MQAEPDEESRAIRRAWARLPRLPRWLSPLATFLVFCGAVVVIHNELAAHRFGDIARSLTDFGWPALGAVIGLAAVSYASLIGAERLALGMIARDLPVSRIWRPSFAAYALGNALGFSFATTPAVRARLYRNTLAPAEIAAVSAITGVGAAVGGFTAAGLGLLWGADEIARHAFGAPLLWRLVGLLFVAPATLWFAIAWRARRSAQILGVSVTGPRPAAAALQIMLGVVDWAAAAGVLYILLPAHGGWSFPAFVSVFGASGFLGAVSGSPGGLGVFEAGILALAPATQHAPAALAALIVYRFVYTLLPLGLAAALLAFDVARTPSPAMRAAARLGAEAIELAPRFFAVLVFAGGVVLLLSSASPGMADRLGALAHAAPLFIVELSHFFASITGVLMMVVAAGLWRKSRGAYVATLVLLIAGAALALLKGLDVEEAAILALIALALAFCGRAFTRKARLLSEPLSLTWLAALFGAAASAAWLGLFSYRDVAYRDELWWTFLRDADASRFLRAAAGAGIVVALVSAWSLFAPPRTRWRGKPGADQLARAASIVASAQVMRADAHLALLGDKDLIFSPSGKTFLMFRARGRRWIAMSEPCGLADERCDLMWRFAEAADEAGASPVFYSATAAILPDLAELGLAVRKIGETAVVALSGFSLEGKAHSGLRQSRNRIEKDGGRFEVLPPGSASLHADALRGVSDAWLARHAGAEKAFSLGRFDVPYLDTTPLAIVRSSDEIVAFANVWITNDKRELSIDMMRYGEHAPKNVMDYLFVKLIEWGRAQGYRELDLGMAPLSGLEGRRLAPALSRMGAIVFAEGESVYGFRGLRAYKDKFDPEWRPLYIAAPPRVMMPAALLDIALLTSGGWRGIFR